MTARKTNPESPSRILAVCALDIMAWKLLRPWFLALLAEGYEVHVACARSTYFAQLEADGFRMHEIPIQRRFNPFAHIGPVWALYRLLKQERFDVVNTHSPVAAAIGRLAARLAGIKVVVYTVHGFYFHDDTSRWTRRAFIALEWVLGRMTNYFMFVSDEDRLTALRERIVRNGATAMTIYNGVDLAAYPPRNPSRETSRELRRQLNIPEGAPVVGIVGRVVREKGYIEFAEMARLVSSERNDVRFLVVGDALPSDRDGIVAELRSHVQAGGLEENFRFTGFSDRVADYLRIMDIFVLPTYREGFPRSVLEAMSTALPVVTTYIRGCREAVVNGQTGLLVPPRDGVALAEAVNHLLRNPDVASNMGSAGRDRVVRLYDQNLVQKLFVDAINTALERQTPTPSVPGRFASRLFDLIASGCALIILAPLLAVIAGAVRLALGPHPLFIQSRVGLNDRIFALYKFRTMTDKRDNTGKLLSDDSRLTSFGRLLRTTSLDELPQLWNVLKGDMHLVGPRPLLPEYLPRYNALQRRRHEVKPGITGWVQVNGRNALTWEQKFDLDVWYVDHRSLGLDLKILWMTALKVIHRDGISQDGHATMPEFRGEHH